MNAFHVTYETVTPESAEHADAAERGFVLVSGEHVDTTQAPCGPAFLPIKEQCAMSLRDALLLMSGVVEDSGRWFTECDARRCYRSGAETRYSLHPPDSLSGASYARLARFLKADGSSESFIYRKLGARKRWRVNVIYADGKVRIHDTATLQQADSYACRESRKVGHVLIDRDTGNTVTVKDVAIEPLF